MTDSVQTGSVQTGSVQVPEGVPECIDEVCVTCSDTAVPGRVVALLADDLAIVGTAAGEEEVSVALVTAGIGDTVLVHAGEAIAVMQA